MPSDAGLFVVVDGVRGLRTAAVLVPEMHFGWMKAYEQLRLLA